MESIFDHNITTEEFAVLFSSYKNKEDYLLYTNMFTRMMDIYSLYKYRGENQKAQRYLKKTREHLQNNYSI